MTSTITDTITLNSTFLAGGIRNEPMYDGKMMTHLDGSTMYALTLRLISILDDDSFITVQI